MTHRTRTALLALLMVPYAALAQPEDSTRTPAVAYGQAAIGAFGSTFTPFSIAELRGLTEGSRILAMAR